MATLYVCPFKTIGEGMHPCGRAAKALREAGYEFEVETVKGIKALPFTRNGKRDHIRELSGQEDVPVFAGEDGTVVAGFKQIEAWAAEHPAAR